MFFIYNFFASLVLSEKRIMVARLRYFHDFLKKINLIKFIFFIFDKNINPFKSIEFKNFIKYNTKKWNSSKKIKNDKKDIVLFENFISHVGYSSQNILITKYLQLFGGYQAQGLLRKGDIKGEIFFRSFGIKKFYYYSSGGIFHRCKYIIKSILILKNVKRIKDLINLRINKIDIGFLSYDSFMRYTGFHTAEKINFRIILSFAEALNAMDFYEKNFDNLKISHFVQGEKNFVPMGIFFQKFLLNNANVYSKYGPDDFSIRVYESFDQRYLEKRTTSKKLLNEILKNFKNQSLKMIDNEMSSRTTFGHLMTWDPKKFKKKQKNQIQIMKKNDFFNLFGWNSKKKVATIFLHHLIDGNYRNGRRKIFKDNYTWSYRTINMIKKYKKTNWIIKQHPSEYYYASKFNFSTYVKEIEKNHKHIRLCPTNLNDATLKKYTNIAITSHGTSGVEYPAYGTAAINVEDCFITHIGCSTQAKNLKHYKLLLSKAHLMTYISKKKIEKAKVFLFIYELLIKNKNLVPPHALNRGSFNEDKFWRIFPNYIKKFNQKEDTFKKVFKKQLDFKLRHTINFDLYSIKNKFFNDYS